MTTPLPKKRVTQTWLNQRDLSERKIGILPPVRKPLHGSQHSVVCVVYRPDFRQPRPASAGLVEREVFHIFLASHTPVVGSNVTVNPISPIIMKRTPQMLSRTLHTHP